MLFDTSDDVGSYVGIILCPPVFSCKPDPKPRRTRSDRLRKAQILLDFRARGGVPSTAYTPVDGAASQRIYSAARDLDGNGQRPRRDDSLCNTPYVDILFIQYYT